MAKLKEYFKDITFKTANCIRQRFEDDPKASLINDTLNYFYEKSLKLTFQESKNLEDSIDQECVKEKLNLSENGNKALLEVEAKILITSVKSKCIKIDTLDFVNVFLDFAVKEHQKSKMYIQCAMSALKKLEPTTKLVPNFINVQESEKVCKGFSSEIYPFEKDVTRYQKSVSSLNEAACRLSDNEVDVISNKMILISVEEDEELKASEAKQLFGEVTAKLYKLADCILKRL
ncbi:hypothetical protein ACKWTF_014872 [Chironomus riparius]